ncbi:TPR repeat-containing protein [Arcobacter nitrofigilis DSM 7299]|uniref:beta-lactamase n=2 Tax=Arcobacter TaxID=28196 RepID=D5V6Z2_ARCNC|nr:tetratricopeptide repeat protein [Arcobacter nitrofigilis]ADG94412.1 TPR repeat-containing protein [Arcobacter nitrofigilis DSM 7299]
MTKLIKILAILALLIFVTGCEEKPIGEKVVIKSTKDMDPRLKAYPEAVEWYENSDSYPEAAFNLGVLYHTKIKDYEEALFWFKKTYENNYLDALNNIGSVYSDLKDYKEALTWYKKAISKNIIESYYNLAYLYHTKLKDYQNAIKYYKIAIERESSIESSIKNISWLYHENLKDDVTASAYMINLIEYGKTKDRTISFLKEKWNLSDETIKKGYELQLTMPGLPRRYKGGI